MHESFRQGPCDFESRIAERIAKQTEANIDYYAQHPGELDRRLAELDEEWDLGRALKLGLGAVGLAGVALGLFRRRYLVVPTAALCCLAREAVTGRSPAAALLRRLGLRTTDEIDRERKALQEIQRRGQPPASQPAGG